jgi:hypothetical protein
MHPQHAANATAATSYMQQHMHVRCIRLCSHAAACTSNPLPAAAAPAYQQLTALLDANALPLTLLLLLPALRHAPLAERAIPC